MEKKVELTPRQLRQAIKRYKSLFSGAIEKLYEDRRKAEAELLEILEVIDTCQVALDTREKTLGHLDELASRRDFLEGVLLGKGYETKRIKAVINLLTTPQSTVILARVIWAPLRVDYAEVPPTEEQDVPLFT